MNDTALPTDPSSGDPSGQTDPSPATAPPTDSNRGNANTPDSAGMARSRARRPASLRVKLLAMAVSLGLSLIVAELALAALGLPGEEELFRPGNETLAKDNSIAWDCYCSNPRGYFVERKTADGRTIYCVDHANEPPKDLDLRLPEFAQARKIVTVGDSFTWGLGVKTVDSWPYRLGPLLSEAGGRRTVVSNHAHVGRWIAEIYEEMRNALGRGQPDIVVYGYVLNDPFDLRAEAKPMVAPTKKDAAMDSGHVYDGINVRTSNMKRLRLESPLGGLRRYSRVLEMIARRMEWSAIEGATRRYYLDLHDPARNGAGMTKTWDTIATMDRLQKQQGKRFLVVIFPLFEKCDGDYPYRSCHERVREELSKRDIAVFDLLPTYSKTPTADLWVHELDRHPNEVAHRLAAEAIAAELKRLGWLED
jgi:lysophospholipase L1-like esterase